MKVRLATEKDYWQLAEMKWLHCEEDDIDYGERNLIGVDKAGFLAEFVAFLSGSAVYRIYVADDDGTLASAMFVYLIPKLPKPNGKAKSIAYLTNVFTRREYRNQGIGTVLLNHIKVQLSAEGCELLFAWPSENSVKWYARNSFDQNNDVIQCDLLGE